MFQVLLKALDKKQLNSKSIVTYDTEQQKILEIKGFVFHKQADGKMAFQFAERKVGTMRKKVQVQEKPVEQIPEQSQPE